MVPITRMHSISNVFHGRNGANIAVEACRRGHHAHLSASAPDVLKPDVRAALTAARWRLERNRAFDDLHGAMRRAIENDGDAVIYSAAVRDFRSVRGRISDGARHCCCGRRSGCDSTRSASAAISTNRGKNFSAMGSIDALPFRAPFRRRGERVTESRERPPTRRNPGRGEKVRKMCSGCPSAASRSWGPITRPQRQGATRSWWRYSHAADSTDKAEAVRGGGLPVTADAGGRRRVRRGYGRRARRRRPQRRFERAAVLRVWRFRCQSRR